MKKPILFIAFLILSTFQVISQERSFDGIWQGDMKKENGEEYSISLFIEDNNVYSLTRDEDGEVIKDRQFEVQLSKGFGEHLTFFWINSGGVWTETQTFSLCWKSETELSLFHMRHVSNESDDADGNDDWGYFATGVLE